MKLFVPRETKLQEYRVGMVPSAVRQLSEQGHHVYVESGAGGGANHTDDDYRSAGATLVACAADGYATAELVVKVKEPLAHEYAFLRPGLTIFAYFHFAADRALTDAVIDSGVTALAYETLIDQRGRLPLLTPMSEVAGRLCVQLGARLLERPHGGRGVLLGGVPGVEPAHVTIVGAGVVGTEAAKMAAGLGARVHLLDTNLSRLRELADVLPANVVGLASNRARLVSELARADLLIVAVLVVGAKAPRLILESDLCSMQKGAVIVDVAIDQGGATEVSRPTSHDQPSFVVHGVVVSCVPNLPGAVSHTSTQALTDATFPYIRDMAQFGFEGACRRRPELASALNVTAGQVRHPGVAAAFGLPCIQ